MLRKKWNFVQFTKIFSKHSFEIPKQIFQKKKKMQSDDHTGAHSSTVPVV